MSARTGRFILRAMIVLAVLTWLAALALAQPQQAPAQETPRQGPGGAAGEGRGGGLRERIEQRLQGQASPFAGPEDQKLAIWAGNWEETVRFAGDPADKPSGTGRWRAMPFYGLYVVINYELNGPEGLYHAHGVMAFDHESKTYHMWWFDDGANIDMYTGTWKDDKTLVFEQKRTSNGKVFRERITYTKPGDDEIDTKIEQAFGTEPFKVYLEGTAHRMAFPGRPGEGGGGRRRPQGGGQDPQNP
ncbi:MAG TPA: DUF1579 family protein [Candidatus Acidoferrales bacterium]|nr:DUF1579 family protein [Candidatus Acidoferrales bacterium]